MPNGETISRIGDKKAIMLAEDYKETNRNLIEYYNCLMGKCDPVERSIISTLVEMVREDEKCIAAIYKAGYTIQEIFEISKGGVC